MFSQRWNESGVAPIDRRMALELAFEKM